MNNIDATAADTAGMDAGRQAQWRESMTSESSGKLQALAQNYLGRKRVWADKEKIIGGLASTMADPEVQRAALAMMDRLDKLIVGTISVAGEAEKTLLQKVLAGEVSFHELEYRLANLGERLLIFRLQQGAFAVNPYFAEAARAGAARADILFGPDPDALGSMEDGSFGDADSATASAFGHSGPPPAPRPVQDLGLIAYALLKENQEILLKNGQLSARAKKRLLGLIPGDPEGAGVVEAVLHALIAARIVSREEHGLSADYKAFADFLVSSEENFAFALLCAMTNWPGNEPSRVVARSFAPLFARRFLFSAAGLGRFIRLLPGGDASPDFSDACAASLKDLGLLEDSDGILRCTPERATVRWHTTLEETVVPISVDGTGTIHVLPSASLQDLVALLDIGVLLSASGAWKIAVTRDSARRAFAYGRTVEDIERTLARMSGMSVPQALGFDLRGWEDEYNSIRLFRGYLLAADRSSAKVIEQSGAFARFPHEMLGEGLYYFGTIQAAAIEKALQDIGLPPPALRSSAKAGKARRTPPVAAPESHAVQAPVSQTDAAAANEAAVTRGVDEDGEAHNVVEAIVAQNETPGELRFSGEKTPSPERILVEEIARLQLSPELRKKLEERLKRKLVYTIGQLHAIVEMEVSGSGAAHASGYREAGLTAGGLDFSGKLRVIQGSLKAKYSRLEIRWSADGEIRAGSIRPVSLKKTDRDYILEGEDVSNGEPILIRVGSMTQVSLHKGFLLGDE